MLHVAQFRRILFKPTETFLYNYLTAFRRIVPVCVTFKKELRDSFAFSHPMMELYSWNSLSRGWRRMRRRLIHNQHSDLRYDLPKTFKAMKIYDVRVLHAHFGYTGSQVLSVKHKTGLPLVTTFYGEDISVLPKIENWSKAYLKLFEQGDLFLVEGPHMKQRLLEIGCPSEKADIQRIAIHLKKYPFRQRFPKGKGERVRLLFCGTFREKKGLKYALDAVRHAHSRYSHLEFRIIGDGELRSQVEQTIDRGHMRPYTKLLGFQTHKSMINEMESADFFIHPSVTGKNGDTEGGAPTTILEAQACGLPILSTTHADIPNIVVSGKSALLAPERDTEALCDNLCLLLNEPERWKQMGICGRSFVEKYHDVENEVTLLEEKYRVLADL